MNTVSLSIMSGRILPEKITPKTDNQKKLLQAAQALESTFAKNMLSAMGDKLPGAPESAGGNIFADMFKDAISGELSKSEALGLSRQIYQETVKLAEKQEMGDSLKRTLATQKF
ncbi:MAG: rod-binding protein [Verrucomicrobiota bacterium]